MTAAVETMAYKGETPWHGLGTEVKSGLSTKAMLKAAGIDWTVSKRPLAFESKGGGMIKIADKFALTRDSDNTFLSLVGDVYRPVQNEDAMDFFRKFVEAGHMELETAGALWGGKYVWALARIGKDFALGKGSKADQVRTFLLLSSPHVHGKAALIQYTPIRVVCWNTITLALGADMRGKPGAFRMPHTRDFDEGVRAAAEIALGLALKQTEDFKEVATLLSKTKIKTEEVDVYFSDVLKYDPKKATKKKDGELKVPRMLPKFQAALTHAPGQELPSAMGTLWGAFNAVTYVVDHESGRDRGTALKNAWMGHLATMKRDALDLAIKRAS